jgi:hypothetical protein
MENGSMLDAAAWEELLNQTVRPSPNIQIETFHRRFPSASQPVLVTCSDSNQYVIKGPLNRTPFNEQVIAALGHRIAAPIPETAVVMLSEDLRAATPDLEHVPAGAVHASRFEDGCTDREGLRYYDQPQNRSRFANLAVLYSWVRASDHQVIYKTTPPNLVWSVDHGHFFVGSPDWTEQMLAAIPPCTELDPFFTPAGLRPDELAPAFDALEHVDVHHIAEAVAGPPLEWGVTPAERVALCMYLEQRRIQVLALRAHP